MSKTREYLRRMFEQNPPPNPYEAGKANGAGGYGYKNSPRNKLIKARLDYIKEHGAGPAFNQKPTGRYPRAEDFQ